MEDNLNLFKGLEKFEIILKGIINNNNDIFEKHKVNYDNCCSFSSLNNKIFLIEVNCELPKSIRNHIESEWERFCKR